MHTKLLHEGAVYKQASNSVPSWEEVRDYWVQYTLITDAKEDSEYPDSHNLDTLALLHLSDENPTKEQIESKKKEILEEADKVVQENLEEYYIPELLNRYEEAVYRVTEGLDGEDCWRVITLQKGVNPLQLEDLGVFWSFEEEGADAYEGTVTDAHYRFRARIDSDNINKHDTILANTDPSLGDDEMEVRFKKGTPIFVYDLDVLTGSTTHRHDTIPINDWRRA